MAEASKGTGKVTPLRKSQPCPECGRASTRENYPFCSDRCRSLDLARWLNGAYAIPVADDESSPDRQNGDRTAND
ncbi:DNA gyrase inhibitor YacG [Agrobacterium tumefaciens]|uniref:DNA gyrase inhibitor YacG n=1 Tax=Agrobacterium tumefaciens TaxID=358 RepID=UPI00287DB1FD|nr:DNA gyrase inhibitor YacG [Agrobacterium tumefaciens]MDS7596145.1 DNA gyrase inhibitor YacG [Agrobacterium tumefaciens]